MGLAPTPGATRNGKRLGLRMTIGDESRTLMLADLGAADDLATRKACGLVVSNFITRETFGADSLALIWWIAGRKVGIKPSFDRVLEEFPSMAALADMLEEKSFVLESIDEGEPEDEEHPLPSGGD